MFKFCRAAECAQACDQLERRRRLFCCTSALLAQNARWRGRLGPRTPAHVRQHALPARCCRAAAPGSSGVVEGSPLGVEFKVSACRSVQDIAGRIDTFVRSERCFLIISTFWRCFKRTLLGRVLNKKQRANSRIAAGSGGQADPHVPRRRSDQLAAPPARAEPAHLGEGAIRPRPGPPVLGRVDHCSSLSMFSHLLHSSDHQATLYLAQR